MFKNKYEFDTEPLTPTQRAETLLQKAEKQFERFAKTIPEDVSNAADNLIVGGYLVIDPVPFGNPIDPILVDETDLPTIAKQFPGRKMSFISFKRDEDGKIDFKAQLEPVEVEEYVLRLRNRDSQLLSGDVVLASSEAGLTINGVPVDIVDEVSGDSLDSKGTLTRLETIMNNAEKSAYIRYPKSEPASR